MLEKSLKEFSEFFQNFFNFEPNTDGFLQKVDARIKVFGMITLVLASISTFDIKKLSLLFLMLIILLLTSKIPIKKYIARIWLIPTFSFFITLPHIFLSNDGIYYVITFTFRVFLAVSFLTLILMTTDFSSLINAMRFYRIPDSFISMLSICYRYIHFFFIELYKALIAWESRKIKDLSIKDTWKNGGKMLGNFFIRALEKGERVYMASIARGYDGKIKVYNNYSKLKWIDIGFSIFIVSGISIYLIL